MARPRRASQLRADPECKHNKGTTQHNWESETHYHFDTHCSACKGVIQTSIVPK